ncbi:MAG TPA: hypothetical protein VH165_30205 [Kofleriaceae bacterium]|nr:hypothetical protein [Kofleriaceae bacterium]
MRCLVAALAVLAAAPAARADLTAAAGANRAASPTAATGASGAASPAAATGGAVNDLVARPLVLEAGAWLASLAVELNMETGQYARPISLAPDVWYGVTPRLTVGVIHSNASVDLIDAGGGLCLRGDALTCSQVYRGGGLDVRWSWLEGALAIAPRGRLLVRDVDPWKPAATLGAVVRWTTGRYAITGDPYLRLGLANQGLGNRAALVVPIWLEAQPAAGWRIALHSGWDSELATWRDGWHVPIGLELTHRATDQLDVGLTGGFPHLLGPQNNAKIRSLSVVVAYRP